MAHIPTFQSLLVEVSKSLGLSGLDEAGKFKGVTESECKHKVLFQGLVNRIESRLKSSSEDISGLETHIKAWSAMCLDSVNSVSTELASQQQVLWMLASHCYVPVFSRTAAVEQYFEYLDKRMPAGKFWYLPERESSELILPFQQVWQWLEELIGHETDSLLEQIFGKPDENDVSIRLGENIESMAKNIRNWNSGKNGISLAKINKWFDDDLNLIFSGVYNIDKTLSLHSKLDLAIEFISRKELSIEDVFEETKYESVELISLILKKDASDDQKNKFLDALEVRYGKPLNADIRRYINIACGFQNAYITFGKLIHGNNFKSRSVNNGENKLHQLITLYKVVYRATYKVRMKTGREVYPLARKEEQVAFESELPRNLKASVLQVLCPNSNTGGIESMYKTLNYYFRVLPKDHLPNIINSDENDILTIDKEYTKFLLLRIEYEFEISKIKSAQESHVILPKINDARLPYSLISLIDDPDCDQYAKHAAFNKLTSMALPARLRISSFLSFLAYALYYKKGRPDKVEIIIGTILDFAKTLEGYELVEADFKYYSSTHELSKGNIAGAIEYLMEAQYIAKKGFFSTGRVRGRIARDLFAVRAAEPKYSEGYYIGNQVQNYKEMKHFGCSEFKLLKHWHLMDNGIADSDNPILPPIKDMEKILVEKVYPEMYQLYPGY
jgi:hypothetical protein